MKTNSTLVAVTLLALTKDYADYTTARKSGGKPGNNLVSMVRANVV